MEECPLCKGEAFKQGDDFKKLCVEHSTGVISVLFGELLCAPPKDSDPI